MRLWYRRAMNFVHEQYKKLNLVEFNVAKKRKTKFYFRWREAFLRNRKAFEGNCDGLKLMRALLSGKQDLALRRALCQWRDLVELRQA